MASQFNPTQIAHAQQLFDQASATVFENPSAPAAFAPVYKYIADALAGRVDAAPGSEAAYSVIPIPTDKEPKPVIGVRAVLALSGGYENVISAHH